MSTIYLASDHGRLNRQRETLQFSTDQDTTTIFPFKTDQLVILGNVEITSPALRLLMKHRIDTIFLGKNGRYNGKLEFQDSRNVFLRQKQFKRLEEPEFTLNFAKSVAEGKLRNQLAFMQRITRKSENTEALNASVEKMKQNLKLVSGAESIEQTRGYEGAGARLYFSVFREAIQPEWAVFNGRSMHPPEDNVNAVLGFLYTLLLYRVDAAIQIEGMDSFVGYFHSLDYGKRSLPFDLMEEYRVPVCDTLAVALFNLNILKPDDFMEKVFSEEDAEYPMDGLSEDGENPVLYQEKKGILLNESGLRKVITHFEKKLDTELYYPPGMRNMNYKQIITAQTQHFRRVVTGEAELYKPIQIR